jgi:hypothetical protein
MFVNLRSRNFSQKVYKELCKHPKTNLTIKTTYLNIKRSYEVMSMNLRSRNFSPKVFEAVPTPRCVDPGRLVGADRHKISENENYEKSYSKPLNVINFSNYYSRLIIISE